MKSLITIAIFFSATLGALAQIKPGEHFIVNSDVKVYPSNLAADAPANKDKDYKNAVRGLKFTILTVTDNGYFVIKFWHFKDAPNSLKISDMDNATLSANDDFNISSSDEGKRFLISIGDLNNSCQSYYGKGVAFVGGAMTIPLKLRFGNGTDRDFIVEEKLNIGLTPGIKFQLPSRHDQSISLVINPSITGATTQAASFIPGYTPSSDTERAFGLGFGVVYEFEKFQIGLLTGRDWLISPGAKYWKYNNQQWIGIGIGFSLFGKTSEQTGSGEN